MCLTKEQVLNAVNQMDLGEPNSEMYQAAVLLLLGVGRRKHLDDLTKMTKYDRAFVKGVLRQCRRNGIWKKEEKASFDVSWWGGDDKAAVAFYLDVMVAAGLLNRKK